MKIMLLAILLSLVLLLGCTGTSTPPVASAPNAPASSAPLPAAASPPTHSAASISISGFAFSPATLTVAKGTAVTWTNADSVPHTVTSTSGAFDSGTLSNGKSFSYTFNQAGNYSYRCNIHTSMTGTVTVTG